VKGRIKSKQAGFTLGEVVIVIAVIAILAAMITPMAVNQIVQKRYDFCREELKNLKIAIVGNPELLESGSRTSFGFVGDVGILPRGTTLDDLLTDNGIPLYTAAGVIPWGWRGPYVAEVKDPWGRDYLYTSTANGFIAAQISSLGPDGNPGTGDELSIDIRQDEVSSRVSGNTMDACGAGTGFTITITYPAYDGSSFSLTNFTFTTDQTNPIYHSNALIPIGIRHVSFGGFQRLIFINNGPTTIVNLKTPGPCS